MLLRTSVVIPYFDHPRTISQVLRDVVIHTDYPVLVVDDGSETPIDRVLYSFEVREALEQGRLRILRFSKRRGKGAALTAAARDLVQRGFTHMLTLDGDGRHLASELQKLVEVGREHPWDLVLGDRGWTGEPPGRLRRVTRGLLNQCVRFETGSRLRDARSGFRLYPLFALQMLRFRTTGYEWEIEVLIRLLWRGVRVREIPVATAPFDPREHTQHFGIKDSVRLALLNTLLIGVALLRTHASPRKLAVSIGLGIFIGCTPVFGFHTIILAALAFALPLNFVAMWLGSHVSTPVLFPLLTLAEVHIGQRWLGIPTGHGMMGHFAQWAAGSVVLGLLLAVPGALLTYWLAREMQKPGGAVDVDSGCLPFVVRRFGEGVARGLVPLIATWRYVWQVAGRRGLDEYYRVLNGEGRRWPRQRLVWRHFARCAQMQIDTLLGLKPRASGPPPADGSLVVTAHVGCWRATPGEVVFGDRGGRDCELIPFLGRLAPFDVTPFKTAAREQRPVVFAFVLGQDLFTGAARTYTFLESETEQAQAVEWTERFVRQLEAQVRRHPDQWFNLYPFWSSRPQLTPPTSSSGSYQA